MKKLSLAIVALFSSYLVSAQTFTVTIEDLAPALWWPVKVIEKDVIIKCPQETDLIESKGAVRTSGTFIEALAQVNLGNINRIVFASNVNNINLTGRENGSGWAYGLVTLCNHVSIIGPNDRTVTINGGGQTYKLLGTGDTISNLSFSNISFQTLGDSLVFDNNIVTEGISVGTAFINTPPFRIVKANGKYSQITNNKLNNSFVELTGNNSIISNNVFTSNKETGAIFVYRSNNQVVKDNIITRTGINTGQSAIRIGSNQAEDDFGNVIGTKILNNTVSGYWNGLQAGQWNKSTPTSDSLLIKNNSFFGNNFAGAYLIKTSNSIIDSNFAYSNNGAGLVIENSLNIKVSKLFAYLNKSNGITIASSPSVLIQNSVIYNNVINGILTTLSNNNTYHKNYIYGHPQNGISVSGSNNLTVTGSTIGRDTLGKISGNKYNGIEVLGGTNARIGTIGNGNIIVSSGLNGDEPNRGNGIRFGLFSSALPVKSSIKSNFIGVDTNGTKSSILGSQRCGIYFEPMLSEINLNDTVGGYSISEANIVGNNGVSKKPGISGIQLNDYNRRVYIIGNYVGISNKLTNISNFYDGISLRGAKFNFVTNNIVGNNNQGIALRFSADEAIQSSFSTINGNFCGTSNGVDSHPNIDCGISIEWGTDNSIVGGKKLTDANIVMNEKIGVWVAGNNASSAKDTIQGNLIAKCSKSGIGVYNNTSNIRILNNIISGSGYGIHFKESFNWATSKPGGVPFTPILRDNKIIKNNLVGILIDTLMYDSIPGGPISLVKSKGFINNISILNNQVDSTVTGEGLRVVQSVSDLIARGNSFSNNGSHGINFVKGTQSIIGGTGANEGNVITANAGSGINLTDEFVTNVQMRRNSISCNAVTGINLNGKANANYMTDIVKVDTVNSTTTLLKGELKGQATNGVIIEVYAKDNSNCRQSCLSAVERQGYLFIAEGVTDATGKFSVVLPSPVTSFANITVTATTPGAVNGVGAFQTSEFSRCLEVLPVSFLSLTAKNISSGVLVKWQTASETNNDYFVVERSTDGRNFEVISTQINGAGNSNNVNSYAFVDKNPAEGVNYYRIKQVDFDGKSDNSKVVAVNTGGTTIISISPNPTLNDATLKILAEESGVYQVGIYDALGKVYLTSSVDVYGGSGEFKLNLSNLAKGVYFLHVTSDSNTWIEKLIKE